MNLMIQTHTYMHHLTRNPIAKSQVTHVIQYTVLCEWCTTNIIILHTKTVLTVPSRVFTRSGRCLMRYSRTS